MAWTEALATPHFDRMKQPCLSKGGWGDRYVAGFFVFHIRNVAQQLNTTEELPQRDNLSAATGILAGLILNKNLIRQVLKKEIMKESVIYQDILAEGRFEGKQWEICGDSYLIMRAINTRKN
ncbi:hypothetical protein PCC7418_2788 [Halothece sp. PCC 7418]|uniref:hypothetical protein n=1 Tax=Halothece sp. (strain PCC 7418) TaxID=65093 RepID=UPI0002A07B52|nr:hypothetical protein [Halothece sp. PCC 7418]AFZ44921.1 hypothetical protein PCC7418_2788 [Halothece sp. PCC 7418]